MKQVIIRRCPVCPNIGRLSNEVATTLKSAKDLDVKVVDGAKGEFTVEVDGREVSKLSGEMLPTVDEVISAVRAKAIGTRA